MSGFINAARTLRDRSFTYPFATNLSLITIPIGLLAIMIGPSISRAFSNVFHTPQLVYIWGIWMFVGGLNVATGILRRRPAVERAGLYVLVVPLLFYSVFVVIGLGRGGLVTGPVFFGLAVSCFQRARFILHSRQDLRALRKTITEAVTTTEGNPPA
jgi:hypothetical protein